LERSFRNSARSVSAIIVRTCLAPKTKQVVHSPASLLSHHDGPLAA
jgi:hypothetical protein